ncbi:hypothetical protein [Qipengyuania gelatinilytica]|uniref:Uncharacterized protein n=1 Tax=Qipengyuania gelatinilytica TaxID=2867231 RepID=A0ABX9A4X4_9SPHN|nr:hypothetical protein [Qipengyuania gelatinilytica]QZD94867.1 hypothetical protein K3136_12390 [Qipengyuania gelatinilytica]
MSRSAARLWVTLASLGFGALVLFSGFDRYSEHQPGAARLVPQPFQANAARAGAAQTLSREGTGAARHAVQAIDADPLDGRGPAYLGAARLAAGERGASRSAFEAADSLGLREPLVQAFFFDEALSSDDHAEAARRLDILLRAHPAMASIDYFFGSLERTPEGRRQLASRLAGDPVWSAAYLEAFRSDDDVLRARARFLAEAAGDLALGCERVEPMVTELVDRNYLAEARALASAHCRVNGKGGWLADPQFEELGSASAFGWRRHGSGDVRIAVTGDSNKAVELESRAGVTRLVLSQPVVLEAGEYRVFARVSGSGPGRVLASLDCGTTRRPDSLGGSLGRGQLVASSGCADEVLGIWLRPGEGSVRLDDIRIERVGAQSSSNTP